MKVTIFSTKGKKRTTVESNAQTWGDLKKDLTTAEVETSGMKAIIGENQVTLESSGAVLPKGLDIKGTITDDFTLFLTPIKVKSGGSVIDVASMDYKACKAFVKGEYNSSDKAKAYFGNYTRLSTENMKTLISGWLMSNSEPVPEESVEQVTAEYYIDEITKNLGLLKEVIQNGDTEKEVVIDEVEVLEAQWALIKSNL